ncbi:MAG: hypothetical protein WCL50_13275, partial [Spirochaetota bacterium]
MNAFAIPSLAMAFVSLTFSLNDLVVVLRRSARDRDFSFFFFCFSGALYGFSCSGEYNTSNAVQSLPWLRLEVATLGLTGLGIAWLIAKETGLLGRRALMLVGAWAFLVAMSQILDLGDLTWQVGRPYERGVALPLGIQITYRELDAGVLVAVFNVVGFLLLAYLSSLVFRYRRSGRSSNGNALLWVMGIIDLAFANDLAVNFGLYSFIYLTEYAWIASLFIVSTRRSKDLYDSARSLQALEKSERALFESQSTLKAIIESTADMIWSVDPESFGLLTFNEGLRNYFLVRRNIKLEPGMRPEELFPDMEFIERWKRFYRRALEEGSYSTEYEVMAGGTT